MKITPKGIGWLIFGVLVCASATESTGFLPTLSTLLLGLVFILVYVMKQFFDPRGIGWFIAGGTLVAFCVETGIDSDTVIALGLAIIFLGLFYYYNREALNYIFSGLTVDELNDFGYVDEETFPEPDPYPTDETIEVVEETTESDTIEKAADTEKPVDDTVEFDFK